MTTKEVKPAIVPAFFRPSAPRHGFLPDSSRAADFPVDDGDCLLLMSFIPSVDDIAMSLKQEASLPRSSRRKTRVNQVFRDKPGCLVVDYIGSGDFLKKAQANFTASGDKDDTTANQETAEIIQEFINITKEKRKAGQRWPELRRSGLLRRPCRKQLRKGSHMR